MTEIKCDKTKPSKTAQYKTRSVSIKNFSKKLQKDAIMAIQERGGPRALYRRKIDLVLAGVKGAEFDSVIDQARGGRLGQTISIDPTANKIIFSFELVEGKRK